MSRTRWRDPFVVLGFLTHVKYHALRHFKAKKGATMAKKSDVHVVKTEGGTGWDVKQGGRKKSHHSTQKKAIGRAIRIAKRDRVDVAIHGRDVKIRSKDSYGNESKVRDREH